MFLSVFELILGVLLLSAFLYAQIKRIPKSQTYSERQLLWHQSIYSLILGAAMLVLGIIDLNKIL